MPIKEEYFVSARLYAVRNGAVLKTLRAEQMKVAMSESAEIKRSFSCYLEYDGEIDLLTDRLRPVQMVDGIEYPLGEFLIGSAEEALNTAGRGWNIEGYDATLLLKQTTTTGSLRFAAGTLYLDAVKGLLTECGVDRFLAENSAAAMPTDLEDWEVGTNYLAIANELLAAINYDGIWFDSSGTARLTKRKESTAANVSKEYRLGEYSIVVDGMTRSTDAYMAYNVFTAVYSAPDAPPLVAVAVNDSPLSPISTARRGRRICAPVVFVDEIASEAELQACANRLKADSMLASESVEFETAPVATHEVGEIIVLDGVVYRETDWSIKLGFDGGYTHKARRLLLL